MSTNLEGLIEDWRSIKEYGRGFLESFQIARKAFGQKPYPFVDEITHPLVLKHLTRNYGPPMGADYHKIWRYINQHFNTSLDHNNRAKGEAFVVLDKKNSIGSILCYGSSHKDECGRPNLHYFYVEGNYVTLEKTFNQFGKEPKRIADFLASIFDWENVAYKDGMQTCDTIQFDVVQYLRVLHLLNLYLAKHQPLIIPV